MGTRGADMAQHVRDRRGDNSFATEELLSEAPQPTIEDDVCARRTSTYLLVTLSFIQDVSGATRNSKCARWIVMSIAIGGEKMTR